MRAASISVGIPGYELPTDGKGRVWVYFGRHDPARYVSASDVLNGKGTRERFEQRLVLIGTSAIGLLDLKTTPVDGAMPGRRGPCPDSRVRSVAHVPEQSA